MPVYSISYDLQSDNYESLISAIQSYGIWWHQSKSTWFIETTQTPRQIFDNLRNYLRAGDKIIVIKVHRNWWGIGHTEEEYTWMRERNF